MEKLTQETLHFTEKNIEKIAALFPSAITEIMDANGKLKRTINFDQLKQLLSDEVVDGDECYEFTWVGKKQSIIEGNRPIRKTLRPCKAESKNWDSTENLYIEGDNLDVLKLLQNAYLNKVKMIYIDPPYNTGNDFVYRDNFTVTKEDYEEDQGLFDEEDNRLFKNTETNGRYHSDWCSMMYPRLQLARNLLTDDGVIFISIDDNEVANLRKICDEIFGEENFVAQIIIASNSSKNNSRYFSVTHEYVLCYTKNKQYPREAWLVSRTNYNEYLNRVSALTKSELTNEDIRKELLALTKYPRFYEYDHYTYVDKRGVFRASDLTAPSSKNFYDVIHPITKKVCKTGIRGWAYSPDAMQKLIEDDRILWGENEEIMPQLKNYLFENKKNLPKSVLFFDSQSSTKWLKAEFIPFDFAKSTDLIKYLFETSTQNNDVILDFFSGSATTAHAVMQLNAEDGGNRKFIMVQLPEETDPKSEAYKAGYKNICEIGKERIRRAGKKIEEELKAKSKEGDLFAMKDIKPLDTGFRVLKVDSTNMKDVYYSPSQYNQQMLLELESNIKDDRTDIDLLYGVLLDWGVPLSLPHITEKICGKDVHFVNDTDLVACFEEHVPEDVIREIANRKPLRVVFRDSSFRNSPDKINVTEIFKTLSPKTSIKVI